MTKITRFPVVCLSKTLCVSPLCCSVNATKNQRQQKHRFFKPSCALLVLISERWQPTPSPFFSFFFFFFSFLFFFFLLFSFELPRSIRGGVVQCGVPALVSGGKLFHQQGLLCTGTVPVSVVPENWGGYCFVLPLLS